MRLRESSLLHWLLILSVFSIAKFANSSELNLKSENDFENVPVNDIYNEEFRNRALAAFVNLEEAKIENLMDSGFNVFICGIWDELIRTNCVESVKYLLKYYFKSREVRLNTLKGALIHGSEDIATILLEKYKDTVRPDAEEEQTFMVKMACDKKFYRIVEMMAIERFNINSILPGNGSRTILHDVVISGDIKMIKLILKFTGVNLDVRDELGNTPLHYAKSMQIFKLLLAMYANPFLKNEDGINSLFMAKPRVNARYKLFQFSLRNAVGKVAPKTFVIDRERVLEDSFYMASREWTWFDVSTIFDINFKGETGIDQGGLKTEWMSLLMARFFNPRIKDDSVIETNQETVSEAEQKNATRTSQLTLRDLILRSSRVHADHNDIYYGAPFECVDESNKLYRVSLGFTGPAEVYKFIGSIMAKALLRKVQLRVELVTSLI